MFINTESNAWSTPAYTTDPTSNALAEGGAVGQKEAVKCSQLRQRLEPAASINCRNAVRDGAARPGLKQVDMRMFAECAGSPCGSLGVAQPAESVKSSLPRISHQVGR